MVHARTVRYLGTNNSVRGDLNGSQLGNIGLF